MSAPDRLTIRRPDDMHLHLRDVGIGAVVKSHGDRRRAGDVDDARHRADLLADVVLLTAQAVFAVVHIDHTPGPGSIQMMKELFLATQGAVVDHIIEETPNAARYYVGGKLARRDED